MTREEAIGKLRGLVSSCPLKHDEWQAIEVAIEALKTHDELCENLAWYINERNRLLKERKQPHGEWIENTRYKRKGKKFLDCSRCHYGENGDIICEVSKIPNFCPNCGADMRKEGDRNDS